MAPLMPPPERNLLVLQLIGQNHRASFGFYFKLRFIDRALTKLDKRHVSD